MGDLDALIGRYLEEKKQVISSERLESDLSDRKIRRELFWYLGPTIYEKFFNYLIRHGNYLHGTTAFIPADEPIMPGKNKRLSAATNGGVALMYSLISNKPMPQGVKGVNRGWGIRPVSSWLNLELGYFIEAYNLNNPDYEQMILDFARQNIHKKGRVYMLEEHEFTEQRSAAELRTEAPVRWALCFETNYGWFKGKLYGAVYDFNNGTRLNKILLSKGGDFAANI